MPAKKALPYICFSVSFLLIAARWVLERKTGLVVIYLLLAAVEAGIAIYVKKHEDKKEK